MNDLLLDEIEEDNEDSVSLEGAAERELGVVDPDSDGENIMADLVNSGLEAAEKELQGEEILDGEPLLGAESLVLEEEEL